MTSFTIYIPYIHHSITSEIIKTVFEKLDLAEVSKVDIVLRSGSKNRFMGFVHFTKWYNNDIADNLLSIINDPTQTATIVYSDPYYWTLLPNTSTFDCELQDSTNMLYREQVELQYEMITNLQERVIELENTLKTFTKLTFPPPPPLKRENYENIQHLKYYSSDIEPEEQSLKNDSKSNQGMVNSVITAFFPPVEHTLNSSISIKSPKAECDSRYYSDVIYSSDSSWEDSTCL